MLLFYLVIPFSDVTNYLYIYKNSKKSRKHCFQACWNVGLQTGYQPWQNTHIFSSFSQPTVTIVVVILHCSVILLLKYMFLPFFFLTNMNSWQAKASALIFNPSLTDIQIHSL